MELADHSQMPRHDTDPSIPPAAPERRPHLLDATMFWSSAGGVRRVLSAKHAWLGGRGWRHTVLAPGVDGPCQIDCGGLPLPGSGGYRLPWRCGQAERLIEQAAPDLVEAADPYTLAWAALRATARLGVPAVAFCHSDLPRLAARLVGGAEGLANGRGRTAAALARNYLVDLYARFDLVLAPSQAMASRLRSWGVHAVVQPLGVDCTVFTPAAADAAWRERLLRRLSVPTDTRLLVYSGRFAPEKNLQLLADAVELLGPGHTLLAIGAGPRPPRGRHVVMLPPEIYSRRLARLLASADAYVHAGDQETFGLGVLEAMACGTPVIGSTRGGVGELAQDAGLTVPRLQPQLWAEAMAASLDAGRGALARAALARARALEWPVVLAQLSRRYLGLLRRHAGALQLPPDAAPTRLTAQ